MFLHASMPLNRKNSWVQTSNKSENLGEKFNNHYSKTLYNIISCQLHPLSSLQSPTTGFHNFIFSPPEVFHTKIDFWSRTNGQGLIWNWGRNTQRQLSHCLKWWKPKRKMITDHTYVCGDWYWTTWKLPLPASIAAISHVRDSPKTYC